MSWRVGSLGPVVPTGRPNRFPLVRFGLLPERFGLQLPGVLGSLPSRLSTVGVPKALLQLGCLLVQLLGAAVGSKRCALARAARSLARVTQSGSSPTSLPILEWLFSLRQPPEHERGEGCLNQH